MGRRLQRTRIVNVAGMLETGAVARELVVGIFRPLLPSTACWLRRRTWRAGLAARREALASRAVAN